MSPVWCAEYEQYGRSYEYQTPEHVDEVMAIIYNQQGNEIILRSDIRPHLDGTPRTLHDVLLDRLKVQDAGRLRVHVTEHEVDQFLSRIQEEYGLSQSDIAYLFSELGYTYQEGRQLLRQQHVIERILDYRVKMDRRMMIQREDVAAYDDAHPVYQPAGYLLQMAHIPADAYEYHTVQSYIDDNAIDEIAEWQDCFYISEEDLDPEMQFIADHPEGSIVDIDTTSQGTEITRLVKRYERQRVPLEQRYDTIAQTLREQRYHEILQEYHQRLFREASIRFTHTEDRQEVMQKLSL